MTRDNSGLAFSASTGDGGADTVSHASLARVGRSWSEGCEAEINGGAPGVQIEATLWRRAARLTLLLRKLVAGTPGKNASPAAPSSEAPKKTVGSSGSDSWKTIRYSN
eukprot:CAMPEP_0181204538 /NCGR_PEP_ID=MMETSP1096-20121128/19993_1 /TAXON_ID=156174 ORGANISM="Chrysochromulina ericina, Strain CCMP281" /NCGR_SAMPLE_ID=MMETSP1096 /ASSEMBLY_ACC=CAM_ASM_000453 /LENGTH=107 /DNA_ID=CAMNT_0023295253 /DNA_START=339 /DNA_END=664 /DNA_ORIENTATION=+